MQRRQGIGCVAGHADIPLYAAAGPGIAQGQIGRLEYRIDVKQVALVIFIIERPQLTAELGQKDGT